MRRLTWKVACPRRTDGSGSVKKTGAKCANRASLRNVKRSLQSVPAWRCNESRCRVPLAISGETVNGFCADVACASSAFFGLPMRSSERNTAWAWCPIVGRRVTSSGGDRWITALIGMVNKGFQYGFLRNPFSLSVKEAADGIKPLVPVFISQSRFFWFQAWLCKRLFASHYLMFRSRNRGSFGFKHRSSKTTVRLSLTFQSRNRRSFGFK